MQHPLVYARRILLHLVVVQFFFQRVRRLVWCTRHIPTTIVNTGYTNSVVYMPPRVSLLRHFKQLVLSFVNFQRLLEYLWWDLFVGRATLCMPRELPLLYHARRILLHLLVVLFFFQRVRRLV